jgi:hypothetical protein
MLLGQTFYESLSKINFKQLSIRFYSTKKNTKGNDKSNNDDKNTSNNNKKKVIYNNVNEVVSDSKILTWLEELPKFNRPIDARFDFEETLEYKDSMKDIKKQMLKREGLEYDFLFLSLKELVKKLEHMQNENKINGSDVFNEVNTILDDFEAIVYARHRTRYLQALQRIDLDAKTIESIRKQTIIAVKDVLVHHTITEEIVRESMYLLKNDMLSKLRLMLTTQSLPKFIACNEFIRREYFNEVILALRVYDLENNIKCKGVSFLNFVNSFFDEKKKNNEALKDFVTNTYNLLDSTVTFTGRLSDAMRSKEETSFLKFNINTYKNNEFKLAIEVLKCIMLFVDLDKDKIKIYEELSKFIQDVIVLVESIEKKYVK